VLVDFIVPILRNHPVTPGSCFKGDPSPDPEIQSFGVKTIVECNRGFIAAIPLLLKPADSSSGIRFLLIPEITGHKKTNSFRIPIQGMTPEKIASFWVSEFKNGMGIQA